jgi:serine phosphatase RsbU (regulator of sigma subunit)
MDSTGDVFVSVALPGQTDHSSELPSRWLVAVGDVCGRGEAATRLKSSLEAKVTQLVGTMIDPASILKALNVDLFDPNRFACLLVAVIDGGRHDLTLASAGHVSPFLRRTNRRIESLGEESVGFPLWIDPSQTYLNVTVPIGPGEIVIFQNDGMTATIDNQNCLFDLNRLRQAIAQALGGAASVGQSILEAVHRFRQGRAQQDDITLLCLGRVV